jgi:membrane protease YdiL (CAAX protease family)
LDAVVGFVVGYVLALLAVSVWADATGVRRVNGVPEQTLGVVVAGLLGLWAGLGGAAVVASRLRGSGRLSTDFGLRLRPWPDIPLGAAVGIGSQYLLLAVLYLPLRPFVHHLDQRLGQPAQQLTKGTSGAGFVILALLVTVGAPLVEELYFRGLVMRSFERLLAGLGRRLGPATSIVVTALLWGLAHDQHLQLLGLTGFGIVLGYLAHRTGRLGPGLVAHASFNAAAVISIAMSR